ncbi:MAG: hypothetical protein K6L75_04275 [Cellvibrionaceae bacterium]
MELIGKTEEKSKAVNAEKVSIEDIRKKLFQQINKLQNEIFDLKKTKQKYERLKIRYRELKNSYEKLEKESSANSENELTEKDLTAKKIKSVNEAESSSDKAKQDIEDYENKIAELKDTIETLKTSLLQCNINESANANASLSSIDELGKSIESSSETADNVKQSIKTLKNELEIYKNRVFELEKNSSEDNTINGKRKSKYTIVSKSINNTENSDNSLEKDTLDKFEALQKEVSNLRTATNEQRDIIFNLENQVKQLKTELNEGDLQNSDREEKEVQLQSLERKLSETEGCIDILESEIEYLNEKLSEIEKHPLQEILHDEPVKQNTSTASPDGKPAITIKEHIQNIVKTTESAAIEAALELIATEILDAIEPLDIDVFLTIKSTLGEIEVTAKDNWTSAEKSSVESRLNQNKFFSEQKDNVLKISSYHVGILATPSSNEDSQRPISDYEEPLSIMILVANAVIDSFEHRKNASSSNQVFKKAVDAVRTDSQKISIQQNYQSEEAKKVLDNFLTDLNNSLNTMNITENQSAFFDSMIKEVKDRMDLLHSTRGSVEADFTTMINKLEKSGERLFH